MVHGTVDIFVDDLKGQGYRVRNKGPQRVRGVRGESEDPESEGAICIGKGPAVVLLEGSGL